MEIPLSSTLLILLLRNEEENVINIEFSNVIRRSAKLRFKRLMR